MALIAEIVGGVAIVVSLLFLLFEIRSNTAAQNLLATQQVLGQSAALNSGIALDDEFLEALFNYTDAINSDSDEFSREDRARYGFYQASVFASFWQVYYQYENGFLDQEIFDAYERRMVASLENDSVLTWWNGAAFRFSDSFQAYIATLIEQHGI
ncbi:MAG: hypothetical protein RLP02_21820 [Coleofasciculus sp. C2-GNP5-27]